MKLIHQGNQELRLSTNRSINFPLHLQNGIELIYLRQGRTTLHLAGKQYPIEAGDILVVFPNTVHGFTDSEQAEGIMLLIPTKETASFRTTLECQEPIDPILKKADWESAFLDQVLEMALRDWPTAAMAVKQGYVQLVLSKAIPLLELTARSGGGGDALHKAMTYLHQHYQEPITRTQLAAALGYHESYLSHIFTDVLHTTLTEYLLQLRLDAATDLLLRTQLSVSEIGARVGFGSIRSFNRAFFKTFACTPKEFRAGERLRG